MTDERILELYMNIRMELREPKDPDVVDFLAELRDAALARAREGRPMHRLVKGLATGRSEWKRAESFMEFFSDVHGMVGGLGLSAEDARYCHRLVDALYAAAKLERTNARR